MAVIFSLSEKVKLAFKSRYNNTRHLIGQISKQIKLIQSKNFTLTHTQAESFLPIGRRHKIRQIWVQSLRPISSTWLVKRKFKNWPIGCLLCTPSSVTSALLDKLVRFSVMHVLDYYCNIIMLLDIYVTWWLIMFTKSLRKKQHDKLQQVL